MIQESLLFSKNENYNILKKNNIKEFVPFTINDPKDIIFQNLEDFNYSFSSIDDFEPYNNYAPFIEDNENKYNLYLNDKIFLTIFPEKSIGLDKILISNKTSEDLKKSKDSKKLIFGINKDKKRRKDIQIKAHINSPINKNIECAGIIINKEEKYFPFNEPKGLNSFFDLKFYTKKYCLKENGQIRRIKKRRKFKSDNILKKIKSRFHKELKNILNKNLKKAGSKKLFDSLPQCFISNISKIANSEYLNITFKELLSIDFRLKYNNDNFLSNKVIYKKYLKNIEVLNYLEQNPEISKLSGFSIIKNIKYRDLLKNYFNSAQFEQSIIQLKNKKESPEYIIKYITKAKNYVNFYSFEKIDKKGKDPIDY